MAQIVYKDTHFVVVQHNNELTYGSSRETANNLITVAQLVELVWNTATGGNIAKSYQRHLEELNA